MSTAHDANQIAFLHGTWRAVLHDQPEPFKKSLLADFVSADVISRLPEQTTLRNVLTECHQQHAFQASYIKSFLALRRGWVRLTPESRHVILQYAQKCKLGKTGLQPLEDDEAALTVRWDIAKRLYETARDEAYAACKAQGLEMVQPRGLPRRNEFQDLAQRGQTLLMDLLEERINIDKTAVTLAVGYVTPVARTKIKNNLAAAYLEGLDDLRAALYHWSVHNLQAFSTLGIFTAPDAMHALTDLEASVIREYIEHSLKPYKQGYETLHAAVDEMPEDPTIYAKVRYCFSEKPAVH